MSPKMLLMGAGVAALGYIIYKQMVSPQTGSWSLSPYSEPSANKSLGAQPSETYPVQPVIPPRVDNSSQPWYAGNREFNQTADSKISGLAIDTDFARNVEYVKGATDIAQSLSSLWDEFGGFFDSTDTQSVMNGFDWSGGDNGFWNA